MEMTLNLTFEDGLKIVEAIKNVAIENGWDAEELDECGVIDSYSRVVDAALAAMGINISIDANPSYEDEDEDEDFDEDDFDFDFNDEEDEDEDDGDILIIAGMLAGALESREWDTNDPNEMELLVKTVLSATAQFKTEVLGE